jgi:hypothetical protein
VQLAGALEVVVVCVFFFPPPGAGAAVVVVGIGEVGVGIDTWVGTDGVLSPLESEPQPAARQRAAAVPSTTIDLPTRTGPQSS